MSTLMDNAKLKEVCVSLEQSIARQESAKRWHANLRDFLAWFQSASEAERATEGFQRRLWDENRVSAVGQGNVSVDRAIGTKEVREWLAHELSRPYPEEAIVKECNPGCSGVSPVAAESLPWSGSRA